MISRLTILACIVAGLVLFCLGCANTTYRRAQDPNVNGIRYYRPATYFLVKPDYQNEKANVVIWNGPDTSVPYAADPSAVMAKNVMDLKFGRGMLTNVDTDSDSTATAKTTIAKLSEVAQHALQIATTAAGLAAAGLVASPEKSYQAPPIFLFVATTDGGFKQIYGPPVVKAPAPKDKLLSKP